MASLVLGVAGAAIGSMMGPMGASFGFALGSAAGGLLFPPKGPDGPRLNDLSVQSSTYGKGIPIPYGTDRVAGNIIWADKIQEHAHEEGGSGGPEYTTYSYTCSFASSIVAGPIAGILRIWADGLLIYDRRPTATGEAIGFRASSHKIYLGTEDQLPDPTIQALIGDTPAYRGQAYIVFDSLQLEKFGNRIPSLSFEYVTNGSDVIPATSTFGEAYGITPGAGQYDDLFSSDMDPATGRIWLATESGHAVLDEATGKYVIDPNAPKTTQVQEYDPVTKELVAAINIPGLAAGSVAVSEGIVYVGRGKPGTAPPHPMQCPAPIGVPPHYCNSGALPYSHGYAIDAASKRILSDLKDTAANGQFNGLSYWPGVPVAPHGSGMLYMAGMNGGMGGFGNAFRVGPFGPFDQSRKDFSCSCGPYPIDYDGYSISLPGWAFLSTAVPSQHAVIVQGFGGTFSSESYLAWVTGGPAQDASVAHVIVPGSTVNMPAFAWDETTQTIWVFGESGEGQAGYENNNTLYAVTRTAEGLAIRNTGFVMPVVAGAVFGDDVKAISADPKTGVLRVLAGGGISETAILYQVDPVKQEILGTYPTDAAVKSVRGVRMYDYPDQQKVIYADGYNLYDIPYGSPLIASPVNLGAIVADLSGRAGLALADIDVAELTDMVDGYTITHQMAARSAIEPLMQAYFFDPVESDDRIKFRKRGRATVATIPDDDLAAHSSGSEPPDLVQVKRKQGLDLPQSVSVKYKNPAADYQTSTQYERRQTGRSMSDVTVDIPVVLSDAKAKQVAAAALYSAWAERTGLTFATSLAYAALEPTDMVIVHRRLVRIVHKKRNGGILEWEAYADGNTIYPSEAISQGGAAAPSGPVDQAIPSVPATQLIAIDAPVAQEGAAGPVMTFAVQGKSTGFTGAQIWKSVDGGVSYQPTASAPSASLIGMAQNALGDYQGGDTFDEINTVTVKLLPSSTGATLSSATELAVLNGANAALVGNEVLQYKRAVLNDDGTYTLSGLLRYRRGTDSATHAAGETFVPLTSSLVQIPASTAEIGIPRQYKAVSNGGTLAEAQAVTLTYTGADLKPYSPVHIGGWRDATGNLALSWVRRTRVSGEWRDGVDVPLGESVEAYDVEIMEGDTVKRTFSGLTSASLLYTAEQQLADFGAPASAVAVRVYQLSSVVGRGFPGTGSV
jgi:hypothetical protein